MVLIPYEQASAIGFEPGKLDFSVPVVTANGRSTVAPVMIGAIRVDDIVVQEVQAAIAQPGKLTNGLLGMSFLDRLGETSFQGDKLYLRQAVTLGPDDFAKRLD
jgi:aspartyl protease family protein